MNDRYVAWISNPTPETYASARRALIESPAYEPYSHALAEVEPLLEGERFQDAVVRLRELGPGLVLSPRFHLMHSFALRRVGDEELADVEGALARLCLDSILATGDGTRERPFVVTRVSDEYDVLLFSRKEMSEQTLQEADGRVCDSVECTDGTTLWFDVTDAYATLGRRRPDEHAT